MPQAIIPTTFREGEGGEGREREGEGRGEKGRMGIIMGFSGYINLG